VKRERERGRGEVEGGERGRMRDRESIVAGGYVFIQ
jgi:hypothetical protein